MRKISNYSDQEMRREQLVVMVAIFKNVRTMQDMKLLVENLFSASEIAYIAQRLNIMRMLAKNFTYDQIYGKLDAASHTISNAQKLLESGGDDLKKVLLEYKFRPQKRTKVSRQEHSSKFINPTMPGSIGHKIKSTNYHDT